jgi:hypothetical protein
VPEKLDPSAITSPAVPKMIPSADRASSLRVGIFASRCMMCGTCRSAAPRSAPTGCHPTPASSSACANKEPADKRALVELAIYGICTGGSICAVVFPAVTIPRRFLLTWLRQPLQPRKGLLT